MARGIVRPTASACDRHLDRELSLVWKWREGDDDGTDQVDGSGKQIDGFHKVGNGHRCRIEWGDDDVKAGFEGAADLAADLGRGPLGCFRRHGVVDAVVDELVGCARGNLVRDRSTDLLVGCEASAAG